MIPAPVQLNVAPGVNELAVMFPLNVVHVKARGAPAVAVGTVVLEVTTTVCCEEHPVPRSVMVNVYVFAVLTEYVGEAGPPVH